MYDQQIEEGADIKKSCQWLEKAHLNDSREALIVAAQKQTHRVISLSQLKYEKVDVLEAGKLGNHTNLGNFDKSKSMMARRLAQRFSKMAALVVHARSAVVSIYQT